MGLVLNRRCDVCGKEDPAEIPAVLVKVKNAGSHEPRYRWPGLPEGWWWSDFGDGDCFLTCSAACERRLGEAWEKAQEKTQ